MGTITTRVTVGGEVYVVSFDKRLDAARFYVAADLPGARVVLATGLIDPSLGRALQVDAYINYDGAPLEPELERELLGAWLSWRLAARYAPCATCRHARKCHTAARCTATAECPCQAFVEAGEP